MSLCINPKCPKPSDPLNVNSKVCRNCGSELLLESRYRITRLLSDDSGFGTVYEADDAGTPKILKVLKEHLNSNAKAVELFQQEAEVLKHLRHPGIPEVDGYFKITPRNSQQLIHCIVMEKIDGIDLEKWLQQQSYQPISEKQTLDWLKQLVIILDIIHSANYFHRDIKPANIMRRTNGQLALIDFGTAREMTYTYMAGVAGAGVTKVSTAGYTPPEQEKGHPVPQSDFFALGRTWVFLLTGKQPTDTEIYDPHNDELRWREHTRNISPLLLNFIDDLMAAKATKRPKHTQEILQRLTRIKWELYTPKPQSNPVISSPTPTQRSQNAGYSQFRQSLKSPPSTTNPLSFYRLVLGLFYRLLLGCSLLVLGTIVVPFIIALFVNTQERQLPERNTLTTSSPSPINSSPSTVVIYNHLRDLLVAGEWKEADNETDSLMLQLAGKGQGANWQLDEDSINKLPCSYLRTIDQLWLKYSNGRFGFSVQKKIWLELSGELGGKIGYDLAVEERIWDTEEKLGERIGWQKLNYYYNLSAPQGFLPNWKIILADNLTKPGGGIFLLISRFNSCQL